MLCYNLKVNVSQGEALREKYVTTWGYFYKPDKLDQRLGQSSLYYCNDRFYNYDATIVNKFD